MVTTTLSAFSLSVPRVCVTKLRAYLFYWFIYIYRHYRRTYAVFTKPLAVFSSIMLLLWLSVRVAIMDCHQEVQWQEFQNLIHSYSCKGNTIWVSDVKDESVRLIVTMNLFLHCSTNTRTIADVTSDFHYIVKTVRDKGGNLNCFRNALRISLSRLLCTNPEDLDFLVNLMIDRLLITVCKNAVFDEFSKMVMRWLCLFYRYYTRPSIRYMCYILLRRLCVSRAPKSRSKRQFDALTTLHLWNDAVKYRNRYPKRTGDGDGAKQAIYLGGEIYYCIIQNRFNRLL